MDLNFVRELRLGLVLLLVLLPFAVVVWPRLASLDLSPIPVILRYGKVVLFSWVIVMTFGSALYLIRLIRRRPAHPLRAFVLDILGQLNPHRLTSLLIPLLSLPLLLGLFTSFKTIIPEVQPFAYDEFFMLLDRTLFLGQDPWQITHALFGDPFSSWVLQQFYIQWFVLMWVSLAFVTLRTDLQRLRAHYLLAFTLSFVIIGSFSAWLLSSAGPCYYGWVVDGPDVYAPLMERLRDIDAELRSLTPERSLNGLLLQNYLKSAYDDGRIVFGGGISAMPSMHIAVATLIALAAGSYRRWLGLALAPVVPVIWIGSIHLGWHYAVDGLLAVPLVLGIWALSGWVVARIGITDIEVPDATPVPATVFPVEAGE